MSVAHIVTPSLMPAHRVAYAGRLVVAGVATPTPLGWQSRHPSSGLMHDHYAPGSAPHVLLLCVSARLFRSARFPRVLHLHAPTPCRPAANPQYLSSRSTPMQSGCSSIIAHHISASHPATPPTALTFVSSSQLLCRYRCSRASAITHVCCSLSSCGVADVIVWRLGRWSCWASCRLTSGAHHTYPWVGSARLRNDTGRSHGQRSCDVQPGRLNSPHRCTKLWMGSDIRFSKVNSPQALLSISLRHYQVGEVRCIYPRHRLIQSESRPWSSFQSPVPRTRAQTLVWLVYALLRN
ncbi:hypothetical protein C8T65DRAFT_18093 [Cerioporus squamosus]|nr:hypothetical protein C8T65DRAFT_18093 [Cerioporus squamosus]